MGVVLTNEEPDPSFKVLRIHPTFGNNIRKPTRISLGCHVRGVSLPTPDLNHSPSQLAGMVKRVAAKMPDIDQQFFRGFKRFVKRWIPKHMPGLVFESTDDFIFEVWLKDAPYTDSRKAELRRVHKEHEDRPVDTKVKAFTKDEDYEEFKHFRGIYSRCDDFKTRVGPFFKAFGDKLFASPYFIKKIPVPDRPLFLADLLAQSEKLFCTDFSQFEATFVQQLLGVEMWVYRYSLCKHPRQKELMDLIAKMAGVNIIDFKDFTVQLIGKRMSGEMNTSCGNGLMNLLMTMYILHKAGNHPEHIKAMFEGDDGIVGCKFIPDATEYARLGAKIKLTIPSGLHTASFCGNVFDPDVKHNVTNPLEASVRFGWTKSTYLRSSQKVHLLLLKSKSLSMLYEYPGCPILRSLANYGLRMTKDLELTEQFQDANAASSYEREQLLDMRKYGIREEIIRTEVHIKTRQLVEELYGISIEMQLQTEKYLDSLNDLRPLELNLPFPRVWQMNDLEYATDVPFYSPEIAFVKAGFETPYYKRPGKMYVHRH
jgi:hypothetical protein